MILRWLAILLVTISLDACALTKETSVNRCDMDIKLLKQARMSFSDADVENVFKKLVAFLEVTLESLKKTEDIKEIAMLRRTCDRGFRTSRFIAETFGKSLAVDEDTNAAVSAQKESSASSAPPQMPNEPHTKGKHS